MFYYILIIPSLFLLIYLLLKLAKIKKHDQVLYRFCQIRRDAIELIDVYGHDLTKKEYASIRNLLDWASIMIHEYEACKTTVFNFRKFMKFLKDSREKALEADRLRIPNNARIIGIHNEYRRALAMAFIAYTPFIRSELLIRLMIGVFVFFGNLGIKSLKSGVNYLTWAGEEVKKLHNNDHLAPA